MTRLFVEQLSVIDCAFLDARRGLVGESWIVDVELDGELDEQSMVLDFGTVKKRLKRALDGGVDHTLIVPLRAAELELEQRGEHSRLHFRSPGAGPIQHESPTVALTLLDAEQVDAEALRFHLAAQLKKEVPASVSTLHIGLRHEAIDGAYYHYTHGLKKHQGHCQRIAHGHRSRLELRIDGVRDSGLEQVWAERWRDIYLGTRSDIVAAPAGRTRFEYVSQEGHFALELPTGRCDLLDGDSTVERIAEHLATRAAAGLPGRNVEVRAYEGVMKGAIAQKTA